MCRPLAPTARVLAAPPPTPTAGVPAPASAPTARVLAAAAPPPPTPTAGVLASAPAPISRVLVAACAAATTVLNYNTNSTNNAVSCPGGARNFISDERVEANSGSQ